MLFVVLLGMAFIIGTYLKIKRKVTEVFGHYVSPDSMNGEIVSFMMT